VFSGPCHSIATGRGIHGESFHNETRLHLATGLTKLVSRTRGLEARIEALESKGQQ